MTVESALYPSQFNTAWPQASDMVSEGDNHLRLVKTVVKTTFPNFGGAVNATHTEANYLVGVTSGIQGQLNAKGEITGQTWSGTHDYTAGTLRAATLATGTISTEVATTAYVSAMAFASALPAQSGNAGKFVTTDGTNASWSDTIAGNLNFSGTGRRITADFSNATIANRAIFQTSTTNNTTSINAIPNGTGTASRFSTSNASDPDNAGEFSIVANATEARLESNRRGTGAYLPMTTYVGGFKNTEQPVAGGFLVAASAGMGYGTGAGGEKTQLTSKSNAVTLDKPCGLITMNNAALAAGATALFTFSNSLIGTGDVVYLQLDTTGIASTANYNVWAAGGSGAAVVAIKNISADSLSEAVRLRFVVIKGAQS